MPVRHSPILKIAYDSAKPLDAQRAMQAEVQNQVRLKHEQELKVLRGEVVQREDVIDLLKEMTQAIQQIVVQHPETYDLLETKLNTILVKYGYA